MRGTRNPRPEPGQEYPGTHSLGDAMSEPDDFAAIAHKLDDLVAHPLADLFPMLGDEELNELADSIKREGLLERIVVFGELILDGRNRYAAMRIAGIAYDREHFAFFSGSEAEAIAFVESKNITRRHLTLGQRSMAAHDFLEMRGGKGAARARRGKAADGEGRQAALEEAAENFGTSPENIYHARRVSEHKNLRKMVEDGELALSLANTAVTNLDKRQLGQIKSPETLKSLLKKKGVVGSQHSAFSPRRLAQQLTAVLDAMGQRDPTDLKGYQVEIDTALQQLITIAEKVSSAKIDEAQVA